MRKFVLAAVLILVAGSAQAASYQQNDGTIVDPIITNSAIDHLYSGANLQPGANLSGANLNNANLNNANLSNATLNNANLNGAYLIFANLFNANLSGADLNGAYLGGVNLINANLSGADLTNADIDSASLFGADLSNAILANVVFLPQTFGSGNTLYNANTDFTGTFFDPVAAGWTLVPIPEPNTALLLGFGLVGLGIKRRRPRSQTTL